MALRIAIFAAVLSLSVGCDQAAKQFAIERLVGTPPLSLAGDTVRFELAANPGGFLGLGADLPLVARRILFVGLVPVLVLLVAGFVIRSGAGSKWAMTALGLVVGGGLGNWLDRVLRDGAVTDFVSLGYGGLRTGIFNVADVAVVAGVLLLALAGSGSEAERPDG